MWTDKVPKISLAVRPTPWVSFYEMFLVYLKYVCKVCFYNLIRILCTLYFIHNLVLLLAIAVGGPPKLAYKSGMSSSAIAKAKHSSSPIPSPPEQSDPAASPFRAVNAYKNQASAADAILNEVIGKDKAAMASDKEIPPRATSTSVAREIIGRKSNVGTKPMDLQSMLFNLLRENPKGMSLKVGNQ